jgi:hypothetical protein
MREVIDIGVQDVSGALETIEQIKQSILRGEIKAIIGAAIHGDHSLTIFQDTIKKTSHLELDGAVARLLVFRHKDLES